MTAPRATLGVLGGMGPAATAEFLRLLALRVPATSDQEHPRIVLLSEPAVPDRTTALLAGSDAPLAPIRTAMHTLVSWGADLLAMPCNTAHVFLDRIAAELPVPVVHLVEATLRDAMRQSVAGAWLTATTGTVRSELYQRRAARLGYRLLVPDDAVQAQVQQSIELVKANRITDSGPLFTEVVQQLWQREPLPVLGACTELPLAYAATGLPARDMVSSLDALAGACVDRLYVRPNPTRRPPRHGRPRPGAHSPLAAHRAA
jgi:aspartate racemase